MNVQKLIDLITVSIISVFTIFVVKVAFFNHDNFQFAADIFRHFSTIRNIFEGIGPYEGPVMQYTFGTHTYFIFYLIAPVLIIFKDPKILILINILSVFGSSILIYFIAKKILINYDKYNLKSLLITISYLFFPTIFKGYFYQPYAFQADTLATPFFLCLFYAFLLDKFFIFSIFSILILSIKEEFILIYPALAIFIFYVSHIFNIKGFILNKKKIFIIFLIYISCSVIIIPVLLYYGGLNTFDYIPPFWINDSLSFDFFYKILFKFFKILIPLSPILLLIFISSRYDKKIIVGISLILLAAILRVLENVIIYATPNGSPWGNLILGPIFFIIIILMIKRHYENNPKKNSIILIGFFLVFIISIINNFYATPSIKTSIKFYFTHKVNSEFKNEIKSIKKKIINIKKNSYIILPEYFVHPFVNEINYVSVIYIDKAVPDIEKKIKLIIDSSYIVLFKKDQDKLTNNLVIPSKDFIDLVKNNKKKIYETENLILYK